MRVYVATTPQKIKELLSKSVSFDEYLTPQQFEFDVQVGEEEQEHLVSQLAADEAIALNGGKTGYVLAVDLNDDQLGQDVFSVDFAQIASILQSVDGEELNWFSAEEVEHYIDGWLI